MWGLVHHGVYNGTVNASAPYPCRSLRHVIAEASNVPQVCEHPQETTPVLRSYVLELLPVLRTPPMFPG